jgi:hypothetical protein
MEKNDNCSDLYEDSETAINVYLIYLKYWQIC